MEQTPEKILVLTLWEPWATLFTHNLKEMETRPKWTSHKGIYLIHSAAKMSRLQKDICMTEPFASSLQKLSIKSYKDFPTGHVIGQYTQQVNYRVADHPKVPFVQLHPYNGTGLYKEIFKDSSEYAFGDFSNGRYAWEGKDKRVFETPLPYKNGQGYYQHLRGDIEPMIREMIKASFQKSIEQIILTSQI